MELIYGYQHLTRPLRNPVVTIGNFDGLHRGHQHVIAAARNEVEQLENSELVVLTFAPHPSKVLWPQSAPKMICTPEERNHLFAQEQVDVLLVQPFDLDFAQKTADAFVHEILIGALQSKSIVVGYDFTFGAKRAGNFALLQTLCTPHSIRTQRVEALCPDGNVASSTRIRTLLQEGKLAEANTLLGHTFAFSGEVIHGRARGRTLGFPTANLATTQELLPPRGVYACWATIEGDTTRHPAVTNLGLAPTFGEETPTIEAHLLDFSGDLYGKQLRLAFVSYLRPEQKFASKEQLQQQIANDSTHARSMLSL